MSDHAKEEVATAGAAGKPAGGGSIVPWIAVGVLSAGLGSALPFVLAGQQTHAAGEVKIRMNMATQRIPAVTTAQRNLH